MGDKPLGAAVAFCTQCGSAVTIRNPDGDHHLRYVCSACDHVLYENPKMVLGCVPEYEGQILLCKRAIQPRLGYWTVPAGFMELGETIAEAAMRETHEEACANVELGSLVAVVDVMRAGQVHVFFRARLPEPEFGVGDESLDVKLVPVDAIPWDEIAFPSITIALKAYLEQRAAGTEYVHYETVR
jgi:ADP-ribose pyrophosphatase YjhB (NUDIX family)